ncbi:hypothetical protein AYL99_06909 [Fonsecaea erecta]|uniref:Uncharacterized protein n=1 Tax=Fonsecaea erecta TaxID=1367422 RepID=A0A178ZJF7_9EURO|nr:hypothetical protein AYL99_06909 [Fonsecaea erecta]OAP59611.1 hypothetical protein AYL99_06909 [Fonsecaea erecta]
MTGDYWPPGRPRGGVRELSADSSLSSTSTNPEFMSNAKGKQTAHDWYLDESVSSTGGTAGSFSSGEVSGPISKGWSTEAADGSGSELFPGSFSEARTPSQISSNGGTVGSERGPLTDSEEWLASEHSTGTVVHHTPPNGPASMEAIDGSAEWLDDTERMMTGSEEIEGEVIYGGDPLRPSGESTGSVVHHPPPAAAPQTGPKKFRNWQDLWTVDDILSFPEEARFHVLRGAEKPAAIPYRPTPGPVEPNVKSYNGFGKAVRAYIKKEGIFTGEEVCMLFGRKPGQLTGAEFLAKIGKPVRASKGAKLNAMSGEEFAKLSGRELQKLTPTFSKGELKTNAVLSTITAGVLAGYGWGVGRGVTLEAEQREKYKNVHKRAESDSASPAMARPHMAQTTLVVTQGLTWTYTDPLPALGIYTSNDTTSSMFDGDYITVPMSTGAEYALTFPPEVQRIHLTNVSPRPICVAGVNLTTTDSNWVSLSGNLGAHFGFEHYETGHQVMNGSTSCTWIDHSTEGIGISGLTFELVLTSDDVPRGENDTVPLLWLSNETSPEDVASSQEPFDFSEHLVKSQLTKSSARRLCENADTEGPHFVSLNEKLYCDMETREVYPTCGAKAESGVCFDMNEDKLVEAEDITEESEDKGEDEGVRGSFTKRRVERARRAKVVKSFKHVHVWN